MGREEIEPLYFGGRGAGWPSRPGPEPGADWPALTAALVNAISTTGCSATSSASTVRIDEHRYVAALAELAARLLDDRHEEDEEPSAWSTPAPARPPEAAGDRPGSGPGRGPLLPVVLPAGVHGGDRGVGPARPGCFADAAGFPGHTHFVHLARRVPARHRDYLLLAATWRGPALAWPASWSPPGAHGQPRRRPDPGGHGGTLGLAALTLITAIALFGVASPARPVVGGRHRRQPPLVQFVRQKTVLLTSHRRDGPPRHRRHRCRRRGRCPQLREGLEDQADRRNPAVSRPVQGRGPPISPAVQAHARRLKGVEASHAARLLVASPVLHGLLVP